MSVVLTHIGQNIPSYLNEAIYQLRKFYDGDIHLITNSENIDFLSNFNLNIFKFDIDKISYEQIKNVQFNEYPSKEFWYYSLLRFFLIEEFAIKEKLKNFIVIENDILIYSELQPLIEKLKSLNKKIFFTIGDDIRATTGFSFFNSYESIKELNSMILDIIYSSEKLKDISENYSSCCPSEMVFIRKISKESDLITPLPLFSNDPYFSELGFVFDPASYGQYLGGTSTEAGNYQSYIDEITYIGKKILNKEITVHFEKGTGPYVVENGVRKTKIFNLHVHSKKLLNFI